MNDEYSDATQASYPKLRPQHDCKRSMQLSRFMLRKGNKMRTKDKWTLGRRAPLLVLRGSTLRKDGSIKGSNQGLILEYKGEVHPHKSLFFKFNFEQAITNDNHYWHSRNSLLDQTCQIPAPMQASRVKAKKNTMQKLSLETEPSTMKISPTSS
jgi:hypothetical protein